MGDTDSIFFPDDTLPVLGYRSYLFRSTLVEGEAFYGIRALARNAFWETDGPTRAECRHPDKGIHKGSESCPDSSPAPNCSCGLHAYHRVNHLRAFQRDRILACVVGWGQMYRHGSEGWRAEYAKPVAFVKPRVKDGMLGTNSIEAVEMIAASLGARVFEDMASMDHWARTCGRFSSWWTPEDEKRAHGRITRKQLPKPKGEG